MRFAFFTIAFVFIFLKSEAQKIDYALTENYAFYVKNIEDFFERFNFKKNASFYRYVKKNNPDISFNRQILIRRLFNDNKIDSIKTVNEFIIAVSDSLAPSYLKYEDDNWYAELTCKIWYKKKLQDLTLIVKVEHFENDAYSWSLVSAKAPFLKFNKTKFDSLVTESRMDFDQKSSSHSKYFLSPVSHGLEFSDVKNIFEHKDHAQDYVYTGAHSFSLDKLLLLIKKSEIKFVQVNKIAYHLLQINGWMLKVEKVKGVQRNSGWLISKLTKANNDVKSSFKKNHLTLPDL